MTGKNTCPSCGKALAFVGVQTYPAKYGLKDRHLVECNNYDCDLFGTTATINDLETANRALKSQEKKS